VFLVLNRKTDREYAGLLPVIDDEGVEPTGWN
jgi:hypothetical protein